MVKLTLIEEHEEIITSQIKHIAFILKELVELQSRVKKLEDKGKGVGK